MKITDFRKGLLLNIVLSFSVLSIFFGNLFPVLNRVYFSGNGDGLMMYSNMIYHIKYSSNYQRCNSMNYPYGEHVFFTNSQPAISNTIKFLASHGIDFSAYTIGILNTLMVFSIAAASILLFLIMWELKIGWWLAALGGVGIAFLSPQIDRFGGHFNLSYVCTIPWFIYILLKFFQKPSWWLTGLISFSAFLAALTHFYLYGFFGVLAIFMYAATLLSGRRVGTKKYMWMLHVFIQLVIPFIVLQGFYMADSVTDRPGHPWGFLYYRAYPQSILLPIARPYGAFLQKIIPSSYINWEGFAYVGLLASVFTMVLCVIFLIRISQKKFRNILNVTPDFHLNVLFWASIAALLYSFGIPYILGLQWLVDYTGPLQQMRGIARFAWIFYFVINITAFYWLWKFWNQKGKTFWPTILLSLSLVVLYYEAYTWVNHRGKSLENFLPEMQDEGNKTAYNQWLNRINPNDYQAIIPLPYFHVGSENIWIEKGCDILKKSLITSVQTGLPSMAVMLSRTSIGQTCNNLSLVLEPSLGGVDAVHFPSDKPFLIIAARCDEISENEKILINQATWLDSAGMYNIYSMPVNAFRDIYNRNKQDALNQFSSGKLYTHDTYFSNDTSSDVLMLSYDSLTNPLALSGGGCYQGIAKNYNRIMDQVLPRADTSVTYKGSVWVGLFRRDLTPRTTVLLTETDTSGKEVSYESTQVFRKLVCIDGDWGLIEWTFRIHDSHNKVQVFMLNSSLHGKPLIADELLIRPAGIDVYKMESQGLRKNNRLYR